MCGIAGFLRPASGSQGSLERIATAMGDSLRHRGPDSHGNWTDAEAGIALAHRRLSIIDLSPAGHQPMVSACGRFVLVYNGEIYSHDEMRPSLEAKGCRFRGHSDTEVILELIAAVGIDATLPKLIGMFAFAVWDRRERTLKLVRDRLGIKPLYWAKFGSLFLFGSELKAFRAHPDWHPSIDSGAVASFLRHNYVPAPRSIYQNVQKLEPGSVLTLPWQGEPSIERFWDARVVARQGLANPLAGDDTELTDRLETLLKDAVKRRMIADVPLGAFLSGGVDSSAVVALMRASASGPVKTYTIGFDVPGYDEAPYAAAVARHLGTEHTELTVTASQAIDLVPKLPDIYDEPFADSSQIPTYLVSEMTRRHVTVALSGDGGDELFAGYNRHQLATGVWRGVSFLPQSLRQAAAAALTSISAEQWSRLLSAVPGRRPAAHIGEKIHKLASVLGLAGSDALYRRLVSHWEPQQLMPDTVEPKSVIWDESVAGDFPHQLDRMQFLDLVTYLPDDILTKIDRASMAVALEARVPLLDHRVVEFAWQLPHRSKIRGSTSKWLLRQMLYRYVPRELIERPKMGFGIPLGDWLRGPLRAWAEELLDERRLREGGLLDAKEVRRCWDEHLRGGANLQFPIWDVLMLEAWRERWDGAQIASEPLSKASLPS